MKIAVASLFWLVAVPALAQAPVGLPEAAPVPTPAAAASQASSQATSQAPAVEAPAPAPVKAAPSAPAAPPASPAPAGDRSESGPERGIVCFSAREASDRIARLRLYNPLVAMQANARRLRAEPLRSRLCRSGGQLIYELSLIRKEGRVLRIHLNAQTGRVIASPRN